MEKQNWNCTALSLLLNTYYLVCTLKIPQPWCICFMFFSGMFISAVFWGTIADKYGRRPTLILTSVFLCYFGFLVSFSFRHRLWGIVMIRRFFMISNTSVSLLVSRCPSVIFFWCRILNVITCWKYYYQVKYNYAMNPRSYKYRNMF